MAPQESGTVDYMAGLVVSYFVAKIRRHPDLPFERYPTHAAIEVIAFDEAGLRAILI